MALTKFTVTFTKYSGVQHDPVTTLASFPVEASTRSEALRTALEMWRTGNQTDEWETVSVAKPWDWGKK
jgi:hypothetical protein